MIYAFCNIQFNVYSLLVLCIFFYLSVEVLVVVDVCKSKVMIC